MSDKDKIKKYTEAAETCIGDESEDKEAEKESLKKNKVKDDDTVKKLEAELKSAKQEAKESYDRFLRVSADFENYKKRTSREMSEFRKFANESLIKDLLLVVDNLERAVISSKDNACSDSSVVEGINMTLKEIKKIFERFGVKSIESLEKPFDPVFHQAVMQENSDIHPENTVLKELQRGYTIHDRLLRPSMVVVSEKKPKNGSDKDK
ncbi:MAG: nucleotide exchange factor GrpE [Deltaproteobacteria bacterium]|nr:MAG: nucleotide exchange factor GrpE [Deltaproteobacteria bacterium]